MKPILLAELNDEAVYVRTSKGQALASGGALEMDAPERRLLLLVNGYTPLRALIELVEPKGDMRGAIERLVQNGLIEHMDRREREPLHHRPRRGPVPG